MQLPADRRVVVLAELTAPFGTASLQVAATTAAREAQVSGLQVVYC